MKLRTGHASLQFGDSDKHHTQDLEKIFSHGIDRRWAWITGTEAGPGSGNTGEEIIRIARDAGYRPHVPEVHGKDEAGRTDCWLAVREDLIDSDWRTNFKLAIPGSAKLYADLGREPDSFPRWGPKGLVSAFWKSDLLGPVNLGVGHYLTEARSPHTGDVKGIDHWEWNQKLAKVIANWGREVGKGRALAFYNGDQNMADSKNNEPQGDTFMGGPFTSLADELKKWQNTGHGPIDVMASYNQDSRVQGRDFVVLDDKEFFLNMDHFLCEGTYQVEPLPTKR